MNLSVKKKIIIQCTVIFILLLQIILFTGLFFGLFLLMLKRHFCLLLFNSLIAARLSLNAHLSSLNLQPLTANQ